MAEQVQTNNNSTLNNNQGSVLCLNNCGFFGNPKTQNYCSKCYQEIAKPQNPAETKSTDNLVSPASSPSPSPSTPSVNPPTLNVPALAIAPTSTPTFISTPTLADNNNNNNEKSEQKKKNRCFSCNKKVGILGFPCRCEFVFCGEHRLPQFHNCQFDNKKLAQDNIRKANPKVETHKIEKI